MNDKFSQHSSTILREDRLGFFTLTPFLPVHFHWTTTECQQQGRGNEFLMPLASQETLGTTSIRTREKLGGLLKFTTTRPHEFFDHTSWMCANWGDFQGGDDFGGDGTERTADGQLIPNCLSRRDK